MARQECLAVATEQGLAGTGEARQEWLAAATAHAMAGMEASSEPVCHWWWRERWRGHGHRRRCDRRPAYELRTPGGEAGATTAELRPTTPDWLERKARVSVRCDARAQPGLEIIGCFLRARG